MEFFTKLLCKLFQYHGHLPVISFFEQYFRRKTKTIRKILKTIRRDQKLYLLIVDGYNKQKEIEYEYVGIYEYSLQIEKEIIQILRSNLPVEKQRYIITEIDIPFGNKLSTIAQFSQPQREIIDQKQKTTKKVIITHFGFLHYISDIVKSYLLSLEEPLIIDFRAVPTAHEIEAEILLSNNLKIKYDPSVLYIWDLQNEEKIKQKINQWENLKEIHQEQQ